MYKMHSSFEMVFLYLTDLFSLDFLIFSMRSLREYLVFLILSWTS